MIVCRIWPIVNLGKPPAAAEVQAEIAIRPLRIQPIRRQRSIRRDSELISSGAGAIHPIGCETEDFCTGGISEVRRNKSNVLPVHTQFPHCELVCRSSRLVDFHFVDANYVGEHSPKASVFHHSPQHR